VAIIPTVRDSTMTFNEGNSMMRIRMSSPLLLLTGLIVGLLAMWAVASPVGTTGDLITGGWTTCYAGVAWYACSSKSCESGITCTGTELKTCSTYDVPGACSGGYISVATCTAGGSWYPHPGAPSGCTGTCNNMLYTATCY
jgi:hypothetical protein